MTYVLTNAHMVPVQVSPGASRQMPGKPGLMTRLRDAMMESRRRSAERKLRSRSLLVNEAGIVLGGIPFATLSSDELLPFNR